MAKIIYTKTNPGTVGIGGVCSVVSIFVPYWRRVWESELNAMNVKCMYDTPGFRMNGRHFSLMGGSDSTGSFALATNIFLIEILNPMHSCITLPTNKLQT